VLHDARSERKPTTEECTNKVPPYWDPAHEDHYSFRKYSADVALWYVVTYLQPHRQAPAMTIRLEGAAAELTRSLAAAHELKVGAISMADNAIL